MFMHVPLDHMLDVSDVAVKHVTCMHIPRHILCAAVGTREPFRSFAAPSFATTKVFIRLINKPEVENGNCFEVTRALWGVHKESVD